MRQDKECIKRAGALRRSASRYQLHQEGAHKESRRVKIKSASERRCIKKEHTKTAYASRERALQRDGALRST